MNPVDLHWPAAPGAYVLGIRLEQATHLTIGRFGVCNLPAGWYAYVGSALGPGGLRARLSRHCRRDKKMHWHIDHVLTVGVLEQVWYIESATRLECAWACTLAQLPHATIPIPGLGASDCRCPGHLIHFAAPPTRLPYPILPFRTGEYLMFQDISAQNTMRIRLDINNMIGDVVGPRGIGQSEIAALQPRITVAQQALADKRRQNPIGEWLAWMDLPYQDEVIGQIEEAARQVRQWCDTMVVLGIGGSALGAQAVHSALNPALHNMLPADRRGGARLFILDNVDPEWVGELLDSFDLRTTCFNVISKSGTTAETTAQFLLVRQAIAERLGPDALTRHILVTTDARKGVLRPIVEQEGYASFVVPDGVGGRFSVLSAVGLLPLAVSGIDIRQLLAGAALADQMCQQPDVWHNPACMNAALHYLAYQKGCTISVMMPYVQSLYGIADWYRQLWAESLGKRYDRSGAEVFVGATPIKALGATDQHSQVQLYREGAFDKVVNFIAVDRYRRELVIPQAYSPDSELGYLGGHTLNELIQAEQQATALALADAERMNCTWRLPQVNAFTVGQLLYLLEVQTAIAGELFNINAFDQPGVEAGKIATYALLGRHGYEGQGRQIQAKLAQRSEVYVI